MKIKVYLSSEDDSTLEMEGVSDWSVGTVGELYVLARVPGDGHGYGRYNKHVFAAGEWQRVDTLEYL